jgi:glycosyltransferase involved in cell wall biosynthesis
VRTITLFDNCRDGHHLTYLKLLSKLLLQMGHRVMVLCQQSAELREWLTVQCPSLCDRWHVIEVTAVDPPRVPLLGKLPRTALVLAEWRYAAVRIHAAAKEIGHTPDLVFFPWLDSYLSDYLTHHPIDWLFPYAWSGLYLQPLHLRTGFRKLPILNLPLTSYQVLRSHRCQSVALLDEREVKPLLSYLHKPVIAFPDLTDETLPDLKWEVISEINRRAAGRKIVGLVGGLTRRKGLFTLLKVAQQMPTEDWFFVFAGQLYRHELTDEEQVAIQSAQEQLPHCFFYLHRIPDEGQFNAVIHTCDVLFAAYERFPYSSNILTKAAVFDKPIIVSNGGLMGDRTRVYGLGLTIEEGSVKDCMNALQALHANLTGAQRQWEPDFAGYRQVHSLQQMRRAFETIFPGTELSTTADLAGVQR